LHGAQHASRFEILDLLNEIGEHLGDGLGFPLFRSFLA
jgi:hypothetical protein